MEFNIKTDKKDILSTIFRLKKDIYDKTITDEQLIALADKFTKYGVFVVGIDNGSDVGYTAFYCNDKVNMSAFISVIIVDSKYQGHGYGRKILEEAQRIARENEMNTLRLEVNHDNAAALGFYEKLGFQRELETNTGFILKKKM